MAESFEIEEIMWHKLLMTGANYYLRLKARQRPALPLSLLSPGEIERVLLISATGLGDTLFSTPAIRALKECYPHWRLDVLADRRFAALLAHNPHINKIWSYPGRKGLLKLGRELSFEGYKLAVILHGNDPEATWLAAAAGSPFIIGSAGSPLSFAYSASVARTDPFEHAVEIRLNFVRLVGADTENKRMELFLPPDEKARAQEILRRHFGAPPRLLLALHPTGSASYKWWPQKSFIALGNYLSQAYGAALLVISGPKDREVAEALAAQISAPSLVTGGRFPLLTVGGLLSQCRLLVGNDSGPLHMALALGVPSLALLGPDHPKRIGPYQVEWGAFLHRKDEVCVSHECLRTRKCGDNRCMQAIGPDEVVAAIKTWWEPRYLK